MKTFSSKALHIIMALAADNSLLCLLYFNFKMKSRIYIIFDNFFFSLYFPINDNNDDNNLIFFKTSRPNLPVLSQLFNQW